MMNEEYMFLLSSMSEILTLYVIFLLCRDSLIQLITFMPETTRRLDENNGEKAVVVPDSPDQESGRHLVETDRKRFAYDFTQIIDEKGIQYPGKNFGLSKENCNFSEIFDSKCTAAHDYGVQCCRELSLHIDDETIIAIASQVLTYCIKEFCQDIHGSSFDDWMKKRIRLVLVSLQSAEWEGANSVQSHGVRVTKYAISAHRTIKNEADFYRRTYNEQRERSFVDWCKRLQITGDTHEERIMAATIHCAPLIYRWLHEGSFFENRSMQLVSFCSLNQSLWQHNPDFDRDFLKTARTRVMTRCSLYINKGDKVFARGDAMPTTDQFVPNRSDKVDNSTTPEPTPDFVVETPKRDIRAEIKARERQERLAVTKSQSMLSSVQKIVVESQSGQRKISHPHILAEALHSIVLDAIQTHEAQGLPKDTLESFVKTRVEENIVSLYRRKRPEQVY